MAQIYKIDTNFDYSMFAGASCAFGVFDGVHLGHKYLLDSACQSAKESSNKAIALTFDIDPDELLHADRLKKLLSNEDRLTMLAQTGVDAVCALHFTKDFASASPKEFLAATFGGHPPGYLHVGQDFRFGFKAAGSVDDLNVWAQSTCTQIRAHELVASDGLPITATRIRKLLLDGQLDQANTLLGYPYTLIDVVKPGRGEGVDFGFATANMELAPNKRVLAEGVYGGYAYVDAKQYRAAIAVGVSPVFQAETSANIEVHILDFEGDLYGQRIEVQFLHRIRPMIEFASEDELIATVLDNIDWVRNHVTLDGRAALYGANGK